MESFSSSPLDSGNKGIAHGDGDDGLRPVQAEHDQAVRKSHLPAWLLESKAKLLASQEASRKVERRISDLNLQVQALSQTMDKSSFFGETSASSVGDTGRFAHSADTQAISHEKDEGPCCRTAAPLPPPPPPPTGAAAAGAGLGAPPPLPPPPPPPPQEEGAAAAAGAPRRSSYLPAWCLESRAQLDAAQARARATGARLRGLRGGLARLQDSIELELAPPPPPPPLGGDPPLAPAAAAAPPPPPQRAPHVLPQQALVRVAQYITVPDLLCYSFSCTSADKRCDEDSIWEALASAHGLFSDKKNGSENGARARATEYYQAEHDTFAFMEMIAPSQSTNKGGLGRRSDKKRTPSFRSQKDLRAATLAGLRGLCLVTARGAGGGGGQARAPIPRAARAAAALRARGAPAALAALLPQAEEGRIQELACCALANFLCAPPPPCPSSSSSPLDPPNNKDNKIDSQQEKTRGLEKHFIGLLTSPNACLTVCHGSRLNGSYLSATRCQGMASKHASRALLNWWSDDSSLQILMGMETYGIHGNPLVLSPSAPLTDVSAANTAPFRDLATGSDVTAFAPGYCQGKNYSWSARYYYISGTLKDESPIDLSIDETGRIQGSGADNLGPFEMNGINDTMGGQETCWLIHKDYTNSSVRISHIAYWCRDKGLWGVWEMKSGRSDFKLQKGGVFYLALVEQ